MNIRNKEINQTNSAEGIDYTELFSHTAFAASFKNGNVPFCDCDTQGCKTCGYWKQESKAYAALSTIFKLNLPIYTSLKTFITKKIAEIEKIGREEFNLNKKEINKIKNVLLTNELKKVDFISNYCEKTSQDQKFLNAHKFLNHHTISDDQVAFEKAIYIASPDLEDTYSFIRKKANLDHITKYERIRSIVRTSMLEVKNKLAQYHGAKSGFVSDYITKINTLINGLSAIDNNTVQLSRSFYELKKLISQDLQSKEDAYYQNKWLANWRQKNSALQPIIDDINTRLEQVKNETHSIVTSKPIQKSTTVIKKKVAQNTKSNTTSKAKAETAFGTKTSFNLFDKVFGKNANPTTQDVNKFLHKVNTQKDIGAVTQLIKTMNGFG